MHLCTAKPVILGLLIAASGDARAENAPDGGDLKALLGRVASAYGGATGIAGLAHQTATGSVVSPTRGKGTLTRRFDRPGHLEVDVSFPNEPKEARVLNEGHGTRNGVPVEGPPLQAMVLQAARLDLPYRLTTPGAPIQDLGRLERNGHTARVVELSLGRGLTLAAEIDPVSGRITRAVGTFLAPGAGPMEFITEYEDFVSLSNTLVARHERTIANGVSTGDISLERIELR